MAARLESWHCGCSTSGRGALPLQTTAFLRISRCVPVAHTHRSSLPRPALHSPSCRPPCRAPLAVPDGADASSKPDSLRDDAPYQPSKQTVLTLPTVLTLLRVAAIPLLVQVWFSSAPWSALACTALFVGASLTDFLDGYLARKMGVTSAFGAFLDPVADKLMVSTVLVLLCTQPVPAGFAAGNTWLLPCLTCGIIGREITMSALREWAAALGPEAHAAVAVSWMGKWKTAAQMVSITLLLAAQQGGGAGAWAVPAGWAAGAGAAGVPLLGLATVLTLGSLAQYFSGLWRFMV